MTEHVQGTYPSIMKDPFADATTQPFWDAALQGQLTASRCTNCGTFVLPPQPFCFMCQGQDFEWVELPGTGTIYTFTIVPASALADSRRRGAVRIGRDRTRWHSRGGGPDDAEYHRLRS